MSDAELFAQIATAPDAVAAYLVLADVWQQRGDPRGDLIVTQHALDTAAPREAAELRKREGEALIANLATWLPIEVEQRKQLLVRWRWGFVHRARCTDARALTSLLAAPRVGSTLAELRLVGKSLEQQVPALFGAWPAALRRLHIGDDLLAMHGWPIDLARLPPHQLESLAVHGQLVELGWNAPPPSLRRLEIRATTFDLATLGRFDWPAIEELVVWTPDIADLSMLARFPNLRLLGLGGTRNTDALAQRLAVQPTVQRLQTLVLDGGTLTAAGARALKPLAKRMRVDVRRNLIPSAELKRLETAKLVVRPQRTGELPLSDREVPPMLLERARRAARSNKPDDVVKRFHKATVAAALVEPGDAAIERGRLANHLAYPAKRDALRALIAEADGRLSFEIAAFNTELELVLALACDGADELYEAETWCWQALREARWFGNTSAETRASGQIATLRMRRGDAAAAAPMLERVEAHYRDSNSPSQQAWALRQRGNVELTRSNFVAAEELYRKALAIYVELNDTSSQGIVLSELSSAYWVRADYAGAEKMLREAIALKGDGSVGLGSTYYNLGAILNGADRVDESIEAATTALALFEKHEHPGGQGQALSLLGELWQRKNQHARALELLELAIAIFRSGGRQRELGITLGNISRVALDLGEWAKVRVCCEEAVEIHREVGNKYNEGMQLMGLADAAIGEGNFAEADAWLVEAITPLEAIHNYQGLAAVRHRRGIAAQLTGKRAIAERYYKQAMVDATRGNWAEMHGWVEMWIALLAAQAHEPKPAHAALKRAHAAIPTTSVQGLETLAMTDAVVARLLGEVVELPEPLSWDSRIIATLAS
ncbi:MAG: tetratricopeptide repeat protein [Kofleriaceae bacterium]